jgi:hypothetical protein
METWRVEIEKFDEDLKKRMSVIYEFERNYPDMDELIKMRVNSLLGFPDRFLPPWWRDKGKEWFFRNSDWVREYQALYRSNNKEKLSSYFKNYYVKNRKRILKLVLAYEILNRETLNLYRKEWKRKKRGMEKFAGLSSAPFPAAAAGRAMSSAGGCDEAGAGDGGQGRG